MKIPRRISLGAAALGVFSALVGSPALAQQSLSLSYQLDVKVDRTQPVAAAVNPCSGFNWAAFAGCGRDLLARIARPERVVTTVPAAPTDAAASPEAVASNVFYPVEVNAVRGEDAPVAVPAVSPEVRTQRTSTREGIIGSSRTADLLVRFGSNHRMRTTDDGASEWARFSDMTYQTHLQNNGHKALGVELLVPFQ